MAIPRRPIKGPAKTGQPTPGNPQKPVLRNTPAPKAAAPEDDEELTELDEVGSSSPEDISAAETLPAAPVPSASGGVPASGSGFNKRRTPQAARGRTPTGGIPRRTPGGGHEEAEGGEHEGAQAPRGKGRATGSHAGSEIGNLARRGMSLAQKLVIFTVLVTLPITIIFGLVSINDLEQQLRNEIRRSGQVQALVLQPFAQRVADRFRGIRDDGKFTTALNEYKHPAPLEPGEKKVSTYADDLARLQEIVNGDKRVKDVVIFASASATETPSTPVLRATNSPEFAAPTSYQTMNGGVQVYSGTYGGESCLYFRIPLEKADERKMYSFGSVILSLAEIDSQVRSLKNRLLLFGLVLVGLGVGASLGVAGWFTKPINSLVEDINIVSKGDLDHVSAVPNQTSDEVGLLAMAFNRMTGNLREAREAERDRERIASELNTAKAIHAKLMPEKLPQLPGIDIFTAYNCAKEVGGDYYDFIPVGDVEHLALCVADVSGKGIPGSMVMGTTRTILRMMAVNNLSAADVLSKTNYHVARDIKRGMFVTCVYAILNVRTREMTVASAGHNPMLIWRAATKTIEKVRPNGIALGFDKGPVFNRTVREQKVKLNPGDRVLMYTDGVVESMNEQREEWSDEKLDEFTLQHATLPSKEFVRLLIKALEEHQGNAEQHDDITITTFRLL
ncbi:MAG TPA: SpoIIE family protein phosphatase [Planctomycetota bacterium]|nr:SpoIIE family protein phosphatase [Planctomycetota bacterium]